MSHSVKLYTVIVLSIFIIVNKIKAQSLSGYKIQYLAHSAIDFNSLISQFKGKVIYIDIWATWCGPCKRELLQTNDVRDFGDFAMKNNVIILYICCDKSNQSWKAFISQHKLCGYHILENVDLNSDLHTKFSYVQTGYITLKKGFYIPRHIIIDKNGAVADSLADRQGSAKSYVQLKKVLMSN